MPSGDFAEMVDDAKHGLAAAWRHFATIGKDEETNPAFTVGPEPIR